MRRIAVVLLGLLPVVKAATEKNSLQTTACQAVQENMRPYFEGGVPENVAEQYRKAYGMNMPEMIHRLGAVAGASGNLVVQTYQPEQSQATILLVHGYLDNSSTWRTTTPALLALGFNVVLLDLPGHGFSDGTRADIGDFAEYCEAVRTGIRFAHAWQPEQRLFLMGHSTGAGIEADVLLHGTSPCPVSAVILVAPLLRSAHWKASVTGMNLFGWLIDKVKISRNVKVSVPDQVNFMKSDPLQPENLPTHWVQALRKWVQYMEGTPSTWNGSALILTGDQDSVVDWQYNIPFYGRVFPRAKIVTIPGCGHLIPHESPDIQTAYLTSVIDFLKRFL
ncbi:MAG: alpha/beta hydrolase [Victivallales bacterium]|nr:alpha/beta hydrolase [Victivallales bacterium]